MLPFLLALFSLFFLAPEGSPAAVQVQKYMMTKPKPPTCATAVANWPTAYTSFATTETEAYLWFYVTGVNAGDVFATEYYTPSGQFYTPPSGAFDPVASPGNWCFTDTAFRIAGNPPASLPGAWTARVKYNGAALFSLTFTIGSGGSGATGAYGSNLIQHPDAESGTAAADCAAGAPVSGWTTTGQFTLCNYGSSGAPTATSPGPPNRGHNFFFGGYVAKSTATQSIDVSWAAADIDRGAVTYTLSGYLGGWDGQDDNAVVKALFKASPFGAASQAVIGPVLSAERSGVTGLLLKSAAGTLPAGTRVVDIVQEMTRLGGSANDGYSDNLSFVLTLGGGGGSGGGAPRLNINQVIDTNCPNNKLIVSVTDAQGNAITGLTASNFTLTEGGQSRSIAVTPVGAGSSSGALSLAILIDLSGSMSSTDLANEKAAAKQLIAQLPASDSVAIYSFASSVRLVENFTTDRSRLNAAVDSLVGGGSTALYRAIQEASQALAGRGGRKSIVLMTDGSDTVGGVTLAQATAAAKQAGVPVFPVGFGSVDQATLTTIAADTGGFFTRSASSADLQRILQSLGQVISSQYEISYTAGNPASESVVEIAVSTGGQTATASRTVSACGAGGGGGTCNYFVQPLSQSIPAAGSTALVQVFTATGCAWTAASNQTWITILSGASGNGNGAVSYRAAANTAAAVRTGTLTIAGRTHTVTQEAGTPACSYAITPTSNTLPAAGGASSVRLTTADGCAWTAAASASWITLTSAVSGTGGATIRYSVGANTSASPRSGGITIARLAFSLTQSGGASGAGPAISPGGIVNAASNRAGVIARGSFFTLYGTNLGPANYEQATSYPIPDTMGGVVVNVSRGSARRRAYLHFVSSTQINGILPSDAPLGEVEISVTFQGAVSASASATVVDTAFGIFSAAGGAGPGIIQNYFSATEAPLNMPSSPARPGQIAILWGTGLGPISTPDNQPPPGGDLPVPVEVRVGGKPARRLYSGRAPNFAAVDTVYFEVPADAPTGCSVPVQIKAASGWSNTVRMAISPDGTSCQDAANPFTGVTANGGKTGTLALLRLSVSGQLESGKPPVNATLDLGLGVFSETPAGGGLAFNPFLNLPPVGTCVSTARSFDLGSLLGSGGSALTPSTVRELDAGAELTVSGPAGVKKLPHLDATANTGPYLGLLGGSLPLDGAPQLAPFLDGGSYTISGLGGKDVGAFSTTLTLPPAVTWTNASQIGVIDRSAGLTVNWTGGDASQTLLIAGGSTDQKTKASGGFVCLASATAGTFAVPVSALADMPPTGSTVGLSDSLGLVAIAALPLSNPPKFTAPGLDIGYVFYATLSAKTVDVR